MNTTQNSTKSKIVKVIGVDLAKDHCDDGERQKFCVHGIIGARQTGASNEHERASEILCPWDNRSPPNGCIQ